MSKINAVNAVGKSIRRLALHDRLAHVCFSIGLCNCLLFDLQITVFHPYQESRYRFQRPGFCDRFGDSGRFSGHREVK
jgi:hypothetical protein